MNIFKDRLKTGNLKVCHFIENFDIFRINFRRYSQTAPGVTRC